MKKWSMLGLIALVAIVSATVTSAAEKFTLIVNGQAANVDPIVIDGTTYIPVRAAAELLGADVKYDNATKTVTITSDGTPAVKVGSGIGDMQTFDGLAITLNDVEYVTEATFGPENDHFVVLDLTIQNTTNEPKHISTLMQMELQDSDGYKHDVALYVDGKGTLDGEIPAGDTIRGQVAFDVNQSKEYKFIFSGVLSGQVSWTFK